MKTNRMTFAVSLLFLLTLTGCFGLFDRSPSHSTTLTGTVKIETPGALFSSTRLFSSTNLFSTSRSVSRSSNVKMIPLNAGFPSSLNEPKQYVVQVDWGTSETRMREIARSLGFVYLRGGSDGFHVLKDAAGRSQYEAVSRLEAVPEVLVAEVNGMMVPMAVPSPANSLYPQQWALSKIRASMAWDTTTGSRDFVVAVIDSGIDFDHPDLDYDALWVTGKDFTDGTQYGHDSSDPPKSHDHGTLVAGIIGALVDDADPEGTVGVAWHVKLMPLRVFESDENGDLKETAEDIVASAINFAVQKEVDVINLSLGSTDSNCPSGPLRNALDNAWQAGIQVVAASGNTGSIVACPANYPTTIAVGAVGSDGRRASYSGYGSTLDLVAPGGHSPPSCPEGKGIIGPFKGGGYGCGAGTSFAAPHVSGVIALMLANGIPQNPDDIVTLLQMTAQRDPDQYGHNNEMGYGLLDAFGAVSAGMPKIFVAGKSSDTLTVVGASVLPVEGGLYQLTDVPEGTWTLVGWADRGGSPTAIDSGDYYGEYGNIAVSKGNNVTGLNFTLTLYEGADSIDVSE